MSDLSLPPLTLLPLPDDGRGNAVAAPGNEEPFGWPTPPLANYPAPTPWNESSPCEIEGLNGSVMKVRLIGVDLDAGIAQIQSPPARTTMPLRFSQFRRLALSTPLKPLPEDPADTAPSPLEGHTTVPYRLKLKAGPEAQGSTVGHVNTNAGLFLFEPLDHEGTVRRIFFPRHAIEGIEIGELIGQVLVAQNSVTPQQVELTAQEQSALRKQRVGDILVGKEVVSAEQLEAAIAQQASMPMVRMGEALMALGFIDQKQLDEALEQQRSDRGVPLGELLVRKGLISRQELQTALARKMGYPVVDLAQFTPETDALARVAYTVANRLQVLPLMLRGGRLVVALEDPTRAKAIDEVEFAAGCKVVPALTQVGSLGAALDSAYQKMGAEVWATKVAAAEAADGELPDASELLASLEQQHSDDTPSENDNSIEQSDNSLVRLINQMILEAQAQNVSDIHVECQPGRDKVRIRFRRDGVLKPYMELPHTYRNAMLARIKIMCDLDISERRKPQDGKIAFGKYHNGSKLELRVATIPTAGGLEDAVLRLLASAKPMPLGDIGLAPDNLAQIKQMIQRPYGMFLCVGPTGSGKTTTLHSAMGFINVPERKIWTAEDPVEITQPGLRQVQVNPKIDWTFAKALRAFLRADPDVIMVGEIRDGETATMAVESSLTGHLVLSTLHTNSAPETVTRLLDMGMDPFNFADALLGVLAQRLVRRMCTWCRTSREATPQETEELLADYLHVYEAEHRPNPDDVLAGWRERFGLDGKLMHFHGPGCDRCGKTGLRGRAGIHELMAVSRKVRGLIQTGGRAEELQKAALSEGMHTLRQDGIEKVLAGITTIGEVRATSN